jgi:TPR repeat protein
MVTKSNASHRRAFQSLLKEARIGVREAQYELGLMYAHGQGVEQDFEEALLWVTKAAERGLAAAQYLLASRLLGDAGNAPQDLKAVWWYFRAAEQGHTRALYKIGKLWSGTQPGIVAACMEATAAQGLAEGQFACGKAAASAQDHAPDFAAALSYYRQAAEQNYAPAVCAIGDLYAAGNGVPRDAATAQTWYRRAVGLGWPAAQMALAALDDVGTGRAVRKKKPRRGNVNERRSDDARWLKVEERGDAEARFHLAQMFEMGLGVDVNLPRAQALYLLAARQGDPRAQFALALEAEKRHDPSAMDWLEKASHGGHAPAQCVLAERFIKRMGRAREPLQGLHWYVRSSEQGHLPAFKGLLGLLEKDAGALSLTLLIQAAQAGDAESQHRLAKQCMEGTAASPADALRWWEAAAAQGYAPAQRALGLQWLSGKHLERNPAKAVEWLTLAAEQNDARAQWNLGSLYASGAPGVTKDLVQAFDWCNRAAKLEFVPAQATLGVLYARMGDQTRALHWWGLAAENGDAEAQFNLATALANGLNGTPDLEHAFHWFHAAGSQGLVPAQTKLGILYATAQGVALDAIEAHKWFVLAANHGDSAAKGNVAKSASQIAPEQLREALRRVAVFRPEPGSH